MDREKEADNFFQHLEAKYVKAKKSKKSEPGRKKKVWIVIGQLVVDVGHVTAAWFSVLACATYPMLECRDVVLVTPRPQVCLLKAEEKEFDDTWFENYQNVIFTKLQWCLRTQIQFSQM